MNGRVSSCGLTFPERTPTVVTPPPFFRKSARLEAPRVYCVPATRGPVDGHGKARVARVTHGTDTSQISECGPSGSTNNNRLAWELGMKFKLEMPDSRLEWEDCDGQQGNPALISAALTLDILAEGRDAD